ncbi:DUF349 domain-containing protein [Sandaracinomonas limnophila]|uniref:DUF349 domain-containing protein n=1 Tax=Sandaracinomonas limnophila TaxID=1862386 RepID=A0A437PTT6_9BACT|nr:DUF349 domain-containing protein [Sandaracinomonas limnophila]RVU25672.1 DUF349 domain-containing protein [Sandaracinomonas limnophila]
MESSNNLYGFCRDGKVYIKSYLNFPEREIGFVRTTEEEALQYFVKRFELAKTKVDQLVQQIDEVQNKGSFLTKVLQMKTYLAEFDGLGDFLPLFDQLNKLESYLSDLIKVNQEKNLEIKRALIEDAKAILAEDEVVESTDRFLEVKAKWLKTGPVDREFQDKLSNEFQEIVDSFFLRRRAFFEEKNRIIDEKINTLQSYVDSVHQMRKSGDFDGTIEKVKEMQKEWKTILGLPPKKQSQLWKAFKKANDMYFDSYNRSKGIVVKPKIDPRVQEMQDMTRELEEKFKNQEDMVKTAELAKANLMKWKDLSAKVKMVDRGLSERFRNVCDKIFEMNYLLRVISYRHANLSEKPRLEQLKIMINQMDYMSKKERSELEVFIAEVESDGTIADKPIQSKINTQKRKISIKEMLLTGFKAELDAILNS